MDERLTQITPSERQIMLQEMEYYSFIHFGINTVNNREWGTGKEDISSFNPKKLDTDKWCEILKASGSKGIILTAKHHDGFCLFTSKFTEHCIANTPYKNGKGDIAWELAESCKKYQLKFGIYLSPWDRHEKTYGKNIYNDYYCKQLTELLGGKYGKIFCVWLDGARGDCNLDPDFQYDFEKIYKIVRTLQPEAVISVMGPDVRWIGNEQAKPRKNEWSVVPASAKNADNIAKNSQNSEFDTHKLSVVNEMDKDLGSYEKVKNEQNLVWYPAEADVSIRKGWFYHENEKPKSAKKLIKIYKNTVGRNATLLLNVPPDQNGEIDIKDKKTLQQFGKEIQKIYQNPIESTLSHNNEFFEIKFPKKVRVKNLIIQEDIAFSQRIESFSVYFLIGKKKLYWKKFGVVGYKRIIQIPFPFKINGIGIKILSTRGEVHLKSMIAYRK